MVNFSGVPRTHSECVDLTFKCIHWHRIHSRHDEETGFERVESQCDLRGILHIA